MSRLRVLLNLRSKRFLLTGSANLMTVPRVADSLAFPPQLVEYTLTACPVFRDNLA